VLVDAGCQRPPTQLVRSTAPVGPPRRPHTVLRATVDDDGADHRRRVWMLLPAPVVRGAWLAYQVRRWDGPSFADVDSRLGRLRAFRESHTHTHTHTHIHPFNGPLSGTTRVSQCQKGKISLDFTEARDSDWQWRQLGHMQVCTSPQTDSHASTPPLCFLQAGCPSCRPTNSVNALS